MTSTILACIFGVTIAFAPPVQADSKPQTQGKWKEWVSASKARFQSRFAAPTITHHVYLKKNQDEAALSTKGKYPQWSTSPCKDCRWKVKREENRVWVLGKGLKKKQALNFGEEVALPTANNLYVSAHQQGDDQIRVFVHDLAQENLKKKRTRHFFDYDASLVIQSAYRPAKKARPVTIQRSDGSKKQMAVIGELHFSWNGKDQSLSIYDYGSSDYEDDEGTMLLYRDYSNGKKTYGAGRFLNVEFPKPLGQMKSGDSVEIDFNFSYNPPCAVSTGFHCPLPQDLVGGEVLAGEKYLKN